MLTCKRTSSENEILKLVYIEGIHDDAGIVTADSLFLSGKLKEAAELFSIPRSETSKQLYCQARLAEMDYYLRELYGRNHVDYADAHRELPSPGNGIDSFLTSIHWAYAEEDLDPSFEKNWKKAHLILGEDHYLINKGHSILGENYYTFCFDRDSSDFHFGEALKWFNEKEIKLYDCYWTKLRLTSTGTYFRDNVSSVAQINELLEEEKWKPLLDSIHISLAYSNRAYILFRFYQYNEAYNDNLIAIGLSEKTQAIPVYQEALKSQLTVATFWKKDSLWNYYHDVLAQNILETGIDYCNYNRQVGRYYYEKNELKKSLPFHAKAIHYCLNDRHINRPVLSNLAYMHSEELESEGLFREAIASYLIGELMWYNKDWNLQYLIDSFNLTRRYGYVPLARYGRIYFSWYLADSNLNNLDMAEQFADFAHQSYYRDIEALDENSLLTFAYERQFILELYCLVYAEKYLKNHNPEDLENFYKYSEENRGAIFTMDMKAMWAHYPAPTELLIEVQRLKAQNKRLLNQSPIDQKAIVSNNLAIRNIESKMRAENPDYFETVMNQDAPQLDIVIDSIRIQNKSVLSFDIIGGALYTLYLNSKEQHLSRIELTEERLKQIDTLLSVTSSNSDYPAYNYGNLAYSTWQWLIPDIAKSDSLNTWIIIPDGVFHKLNFEVLVTNDNRVSSYQELSYLLLERKVKYSPSVRINQRLRSSTWLAGRGIGMSWSDEKTIESQKNSMLRELPGSLKEIEYLKKALNEVKLYPGKRATKKSFIREYTAPEVAVIHLALHGIASSEKPDDIKLYFRGNHSFIDSLYGYELLPYYSTIQNVILSSCETGKGVDLSGEGNYNLSRYFLINGAHKVIATLWSLDDQASSIIFNNFYSNYYISKDGDLSLAKRNIIINGPLKMSKPYYWASMIEYN